MYEPVPSNTEEGRFFEFMLVREFSRIRAEVIEHEFTVDAVSEYFGIGATAGQLIGDMRRGKRGEYPADLSMNDALAKIGKFTAENGIEPLAAIRAFEIGNCAMDRIAEGEIKVEDFKSIFLTPEELEALGEPVTP